MITVKIQGGLGNQMFQYAAARALANRLNKKLCLDISDYFIRTDTDQFTARPFDLGRLNISACVTKTAYNHPSLWKKVMRKIRREKYFREKGLAYNDDFRKLEGNIYLEGYFQCEKYFAEIRRVLIKEFDCREIHTNEFKRYEEEMSKDFSVAVHVRRGDYATNSYINSVHGTCGVEYYRKAFNQIEAAHPDVHYFLFSDDLEWSMNNLSAGRRMTPVRMEGESGHIAEMWLQARAKNNVIANSSFSWWGAWLNDYPQKMVFAPENWFVDPVKNSQSSDLIPSGWKRI